MKNKFIFLFILLKISTIDLYAQSKGDLMLSGIFSPGYAIDEKYGGIGGQAGFEFTYNFTEKVPFSLFADAEIFGKMFILSGGFRVAHLFYTNNDKKFFEIRGTIGGSTIWRHDGEFPGMGARLGLAFHYKQLLSENICLYFGPSFSGSFIGENYNPLFATFNVGLGYYIW